MIKYVGNKTIQLDKEITDLDSFVFDFVEVITKYTEYVLISGYLAILFGRSRGTEDIDVLIPRINKEELKKLYQELINKFECLNCTKMEDIYKYLDEGLSVRFAEKGKIIPNMEVKFSKNEVENIALKEKIKILIENKELFVSPIELQIVYKKKILASDKDLEDAKHLEIVLKDLIKEEKIKYYQKLVDELWKKK